MCAPLFSGRLSTSVPPSPLLTLFPSLPPFKQPLGVLVRFKAPTPSLCQKKLYTCSSFTKSGGRDPGADPSCTAPEVTHCSPSDTVFTGQSSCKGPLLAPGLLFRRLVSPLRLRVAFNVKSQGAGRVQEVLDRHPRGLLLFTGLPETSITRVQRGKEDFPPPGQLTFL